MSGDISNIQHMVSRLQAADKIQQANREEPLLEQRALGDENLKKVAEQKETVQDSQKSDEDMKVKDEDRRNMAEQRRREKKEKEEKEEEEKRDDDTMEHIVDIVI